MICRRGLAIQLALLGLFVVGLSCTSKNDAAPTPGLQAAFASQAAWDSGCIESDRFSLSMKSVFEIKDDSFKRTNQYFSDGLCRTISLRSEETGTFAKTLNDSNSGSLELNYQTVKLTVLSDTGTLALNTVSYCGTNMWQVNDSKDLTSLSGGDACWEKTPRTAHDVFKVDGGKIYFGAGSEKEKSDPAMWPTALDDSHGWTIR